jgi:hypothetical protein
MSPTTIVQDIFIVILEFILPSSQIFSLNKTFESLYEHVIDPSFIDENKLSSHFYRNSQDIHMKLLRRLVRHPKYHDNLVKYDYYFICNLSDDDNIELLKILFQIEEILRKTTDYGRFYHTVIFNACHNNHVKLLRYVLYDPVINYQGSIVNYQLFDTVCRRGYTKILRILLNDPRMKIDMNIAHVHNAFHSAQKDVLELLLKDSRFPVPDDIKNNIENFQGCIDLLREHVKSS